MAGTAEAPTVAELVDAADAATELLRLNDHELLVVIARELATMRELLERVAAIGPALQALTNGGGLASLFGLGRKG
jgi:hypothetical protein